MERKKADQGGVQQVSASVLGGTGDTVEAKHIRELFLTCTAHLWYCSTGRLYYYFGMLGTLQYALLRRYG